MSNQMHEGFPVAPASRMSIRHQAMHVRKVLNLPDGKFSIGRLLESFSGMGIHVDVVSSHDASVPKGLEACWDPSTMTLTICEPVYWQMLHGDGRARFTFGHELGHICLAHVRTLNRVSGPIKTFCNSEWQADQFAAELIMPLSVIKDNQLITEQLISDFFGVSYKAAATRLRNLKKYNEI